MTTPDDTQASPPHALNEHIKKALSRTSSYIEIEISDLLKLQESFFGVGNLTKEDVRCYMATFISTSIIQFLVKLEKKAKPEDKNDVHLLRKEILENLTLKDNPKSVH